MRYLSNCVTDFGEFGKILVKFGTAAMHIRLPNMTVYQKFQNPRWRTEAILKIKNGDISETVWAILTKFLHDGTY